MKTPLTPLWLIALVVAAGHLQAAKPAPVLPAGTGRYILVLKLAGERRDSPKSITEPDLSKLGGKVLSKHDNRQVVELPVAAAKLLRGDANVAYLQRLWMGESLDTWDERDQSGGSTLKAGTDDATGTNLTWNSGTFAYDPSGNIKAIGADTYIYDTASRLVQAGVGVQTETYGYDSFGNLTQKTLSGQASTVPAIDSSSNRVLGEAYDVAGNVTTNGRWIAYVYDSVGSMSELTTNFGQKRRMFYTADDERIGEMFDGMVRWKIRDLNGGQILREFKAAGSKVGDPWEWTEDYVYAGGTPVGAEMDEYWGGKRHFHLDHLGSVRMITNDARMRYSRNDFYPFGAEQSSSVQEATNFGFFRSDPMKFTGHDREYYGILNVDNNDYIDYMHARYYNPTVGRFLSPDPLDGLQRFPQSWNRYAYARNNPLKYIDPTGMYVFAACTGDDRQCQADQTAFEQSRQHDLQSHDQTVHDAAAAYGDPGQVNGVSVAFGSPTNAAGTTTAALQGNANGTMGMTASVVIQTGLRGTDLNAAVGHEGQHVLDAQGFVGSFTMNGASWDLSKNLTAFMTETNAYRITDSIYKSANQSFSIGCRGCTLGTGARTPADRDLAITRILANPSGPYKVTPQNQGNRQFPEWTTPPPQP